MKVTEYLKEHILFLDGGMGTLLQARGLQAGELPEKWNITHADVITDIHKAYYDAGSNIVNTNTFGANSLKFSDSELEEILNSEKATAILKGFDNRRAVESLCRKCGFAKRFRKGNN